MPEKNIRLIRQRSKFFDSAHKAARHMSMNYQRYAKYENGERALTKEAAAHIAPYFQTTAGYLLYGETMASESDEINLMARDNLSLFLTTDLVYFNKIVTGLLPHGAKKTMIGHVELPLRAYCVHQPDRSMVPATADTVYRWTLIPPNAEVIFDPDATIHADDIVHAIIQSEQNSVIRILQRVRLPNGKIKSMLIPLNSSFEDIELDEEHGDKLVGKYYGQLQIPLSRPPAE